MTTMTMQVGIHIVLTFGVHPKVMDDFNNWTEMDKSIWSTEPVGIRECGLDTTRPHPVKQEDVSGKRFWPPSSQGNH